MINGEITLLGVFTRILCTELSTICIYVSVPTTQRSQSKAAQSKGRYGSKEYWKAMYEMSQSLIEETYEKSLKLSEVSGLLSMNLMKPKDIT